MTDDNAIISRVLAGETEMFRLLIERYQRPLVRMIANIINDRHACEDIGQDVFFAAYRHLGSFDPARSRFSTWLFTIARNRSLNALKKRLPELSEHAPEPFDARVPSDVLINKELHEALDRCLAALPDHQRVAFVLAEFEELSYEMIAQIEGVRIGTVRSRINRAKARLRALLGGPEGDVA